MTRRWIANTAAFAWRFAASAALVAVLAACALSVWSTFDQRNDLRELVDAQRHAAARQAAIVDDSLVRAGALLGAAIRAHDEEMARQLTIVVEQLAVLRDRPAGTRPDPVTARPFASPSPAPAPVTTTTTLRPTTTTACAANHAGHCKGGNA